MKRHIVCGVLTACLCLALAGCFQPSGEMEVARLPSTETETSILSFTEETYPATEPETQPEQTLMPTEPAVPQDEDFVLVKDYIPQIVVDLKYATQDNFTGSVIYDFQDVYLRYGTVVKLMDVQQELAGMGLSLKIWDGFRPVSAQWKLWEAFPDPNYVSHPQTGGRTHCRGNTVDVTLVDEAGKEVEMPTGFDDFSPLADRDYSDCSDTAAVNAGILQYMMEKHGFSGHQSEWWHFADTTDYPVDEVFMPIDRSWWYANCNEYINLRTEPNVDAFSMTRIPAREQFQVLGWYDRFALVEYRGFRGYVNRDYIAPSSQESNAGVLTP